MQMHATMKKERPLEHGDPKRLRACTVFTTHTHADTYAGMTALGEGQCVSNCTFPRRISDYDL